MGNRCNILLAACICIASALSAWAEQLDAPDFDKRSRTLFNAAEAARARGNAAEAVAHLKQIQKLLPHSLQAERAGKLINRLSSIEVLIDRSHEWRSETSYIARYLKDNGIGVSISDASLATLEEELPEFEMIFIWTERNSVSFNGTERRILKSFLKNGGRLLLVGNVRKPGAYPLRGLAKALGLKLTKPSSQANYGKGKVKFFNNAGLLGAARLRDRRESEDEILEIFGSLFPYEKLSKSSKNDYYPPEKIATVSEVKVRYSGRLSRQGNLLQEIVPLVLPVVAKMFKTEFPVGWELEVLPRDRSSWQGGGTFALNSQLNRGEATFEVAKAAAQYMLRPSSEPLTFPPWVGRGWADLVALRTMHQLGYQNYAESKRTEFAEALKRSDPDLTDIDLSVSSRGHQASYMGKSIMVLQQLEKRHGRNLLARFRKKLKRYHSLGRIGSGLSTRDTIYYLSLTVHEDMYDYFQKIGTSVLPRKVDFHEDAGLKER